MEWLKIYEIQPHPPAHEKVQDIHNCITFLQRWLCYSCAVISYKTITRITVLLGKGAATCAGRPRSQPHPLDRRISTHLSGLEVRRWDGCLGSRWGRGFCQGKLNHLSSMIYHVIWMYYSFIIICQLHQFISNSCPPELESPLGFARWSSIVWQECWYKTS